MASKLADQDTARLVGAADGLASLHVFLQPASDGDDVDPTANPFVVVDAGGPRSRVYKAGLFDRSGSMIGLYALKVQRFSGADSECAAGDAVLSNVDADAAWARRVEMAEACSQTADVGPCTLAVNDIGDETGRMRLGARFYCRLRRLFFRPRSPESCEPLQDCRDDALLSKHGLATYTQSGARFLYAPADAERDRIRFYTDAGQVPESDTATVGGEEHCFRDQGVLVREKERIKETDPRLHEELTRDFPCYDCAESGRCFPEGRGYASVVDRMVAFSFNDCQTECSELHDLPVDVFADCLGGRPLEPWTASLRAGSSGTADHYRAGVLTTLSHRPRALLSPSSSSPVGALEVLLLKWNLLTQTVHHLRSLYARCERPHLALSAKHVIVRLADSAQHAPAFWQARVALLGLGDASEVSIGGDSGAALFRPSEQLEPWYASGRMQRNAAAFGKPRVGGVTLSVEKVGSPDGRELVIEGRLEDPDLASLDPACGDVVSISLPGVDGAEAVCFWATLSGGSSDGGVCFDGAATKGDSGFDVDFHVGTKFDKINYQFYPRYGLADDLYALGVLWLRVLLVNEKQDFQGACGEARQLVERLVSKSGESPTGEWVEGRMEGLVASPAWHCGNLFYARPAHDDAASTIPSDLWGRVLAIGVRLLSPGLPFGFARMDGESEGAADALDRVCNEFLRIERDIERRLFSFGGVNAWVGGALESALRDAQDSEMDSSHA